MDFNYSTLYKFKAAGDKTCTATIGARAGEARFSVWNNGNILMSIPLKEQVLYAIKACITSILEKGPETKHAVVHSKWYSKKNGQSGTNYHIVIGKDSSNVIFIEVTGKGSGQDKKNKYTKRFNFDVDYGLEFGNEPMNEAAKSTTGAKAFIEITYPIILKAIANSRSEKAMEEKAAYVKNLMNKNNRGGGGGYQKQNNNASGGGSETSYQSDDSPF